jgi:hypothetical protein
MTIDDPALDRVPQQHQLVLPFMDGFEQRIQILTGDDADAQRCGSLE